jgi:hypothetical protein
MTRRVPLLGLRPLALVPRAFALAIAAASGVVAWRVGGGAEAASTPPHASTAVTTRDAGATTGDTYEVATRLIEIAKDARFDMPRADAA